ncbi:hypothetical protein BGV68_05410 [Burkholderia ubonensis]|nr:hypothetical protein BGV68_05410 [Burkholderia ubonensis]
MRIDVIDGDPWIIEQNISIRCSKTLNKHQFSAILPFLFRVLFESIGFQNRHEMLMLGKDSYISIICIFRQRMIKHFFNEPLPQSRSVCVYFQRSDLQMAPLRKMRNDVGDSPIFNFQI